MSFSNYAILTPVVHQLEKNPELTWSIRPPTTKDEIALSRFYTEGRITFMDGQRFTYPWSNIEIAIRQLAMLFGGTNIPKSEQDASPALTEKASIAEIENFLGNLPTEVIKELWAALGQVAPGWGPVAIPKN